VTSTRSEVIIRTRSEHRYTNGNSLERWKGSQVNDRQKENYIHFEIKCKNKCEKIYVIKIVANTEKAFN
jgi:hypothetical protein